MQNSEFPTVTFKGKEYKFCQGVYYHKDTPDRVVFLLHNALHSDTRKRFILYYGDRATGRRWRDKVCGYIGRSTGNLKVPLIMHNKRSLDGEPVLTDCILKIKYANKKNGGTLYDAINKSKTKAFLTRASYCTN